MVTPWSHWRMNLAMPCRLPHRLSVFMARLASLLLISLLSFGLSADPLPIERQQQLQHLLEQDCGSCHGMRLTGGLGPPLTTEALAGKPRALLVATISEGRMGTPMPPWKNLLAEDDINWLVDYLMQTGQTP